MAENKQVVDSGSDDFVFPDGLTRGDYKMAVALGRYLDKIVEEYLKAKESEGVAVHSEVLIKAMQYVTMLHDNKMNALSGSVLFIRDLFEKSGLPLQEPYSDKI